MVDLIILLLVKYSDGNIAICQLHFVNNGDLNGYTKAIIITTTAIIIVLRLGVCKSRMAHNYSLTATNVLQLITLQKMKFYNVDVGNFIRDAIAEKIKRDYKELILNYETIKLTAD